MKNMEVNFLQPVIVGEAERVDGAPFLMSDQLASETGNTGNIAFRTAIRRHVKAKNRVLFQQANLDIIEKLGDIAVIPCANQLGPHANNLGRAKFIEGLSIPVVAIGLGAQAGLNEQLTNLPDDSIRFVRAMVERQVGTGPNIAVRGEFTRRVLESIGLGDFVEVLGCPSLLLNPDQNLGRKIERNLSSTPKRIAVTAGHQKSTRKFHIEKALVKLVTKSSGAYIVQHPLNLLRLSRSEFDAIDEAVLQRIKQQMQPNSTLEEFFTWCRRYCVSFFDVDAWISYLQHFDFVVGTRIHGVMMGIQAGIPSLCITHDSRTKELCETMLIPHVDIQQIDVSNLTIDYLLRCFKFDAASFDKNRQRLSARYRNFLFANRIDAYPSLVKRDHREEKSASI